jgi:hypothetical protein
MKNYLPILCVLLCGCVAYPAYYPAVPATPNPNAAQDAANAECARSGKVAVRVEPTTCDSQNCTTRWVCR